MNGNHSDDDGAAQTAETITERNVTRRRALQLGGAAAATVATAGMASPAAAQTAVTPDFDGDLVDDPYITGSVTVEDTNLDNMDELDYVDDSGEVTSLTDDGVVLAPAPDDETPHNPVELTAAALDATEYSAFPRGVTYDDDGDPDTDAVPVSALDSTHWTTDASGSTGSISVTSSDEDQLLVEVTGQSGGDVATATFDLTSVGQNDATITDGVERKYLQLVADVDTLNAGATVEYRITDSTGATAVASIDPDGDTSTEAVLASAEGNAKVGEARVGELSTTLEDIVSVTIAVLDANATVEHHALNLEKESAWTFGTRETTNDDGDVVTEDVESPSGTFGITSLSTLPEWASTATITEVVYDVELRASETPAERVHARSKEAPDTYDRPMALEYAVELEWPSAYAISTSAGSAMNTQTLAPSRYLTAEVATGVSDITEESPWDDLDGVSWTGRASSFSTVGKEVDLISSVASSDRTVVRIETNLTEDELSTATAAGGAGGAVAVGSGGGGGLDAFKTMIFGTLLGGVAIFRKRIMGFLRGITG